MSQSRLKSEINQIGKTTQLSSFHALLPAELSSNVAVDRLLLSRLSPLFSHSLCRKELCNIKNENYPFSLLFVKENKGIPRNVG